MENKEQFTLNLSKDCFSKDDVVSLSGGKYLVLENPYRSKWNLFLQIITIGIYKAPFQFKIKP